MFLISGIFFFYSFLEFPPFCYITHMVLDIVHFFPLEPFSILIIVKSIVWYSNTTPISDSASDASFVSSTFFFLSFSNFVEIQPFGTEYKELWYLDLYLCHSEMWEKGKCSKVLWLDIPIWITLTLYKIFDSISVNLQILFLFFRIVLAIIVPLSFQVKFSIILSIFLKKTVEIWEKLVS